MLNLSDYLKTSGRLTHSQYSQLVLYFVINLFISRLSSIHFEDNLIDDIKDGKISPSLLKPFSFFWHLLPREATWRLAGLMYLLPSMLVIWPLIKSLEYPKLLPANLIIVVLFLAIAFLQRFFLAWIISIPAFWIDQSKALVHFKWMAEGIFGGAWLPLYLFPSWWQNLARHTPFYYWFYFPAQVLLGNVTEFLTPLILSSAWMIMLYFLASKFWHKAIRYYSSVGG